MAAEAVSSTNTSQSHGTTHVTLDPMSPYFLQSLDNPETILVSCPLNGDNYPTWRQAMINALRSINKLGLVDGSITRPQSSSPDCAAWLKCNSMVISWLFNSLVPDLHDSVAYADIAQGMWADLEERFYQGNAPRVHKLKHDLALMRQDRLSIPHGTY